MSRRPTLIAALAAAALAAAAFATAACTGETEAPEPANEDVAAAMPETPDRSETAADEAGMAAEQPAQGTAPDAGAPPAN